MNSKLVFQDLCGKVTLPTFSKKYGHKLQRNVLSTNSSTQKSDSVVVDGFLSPTSKNAVQNKVVTQAISQIPQTIEKTLRDMFGICLER